MHSNFQKRHHAGKPVLPKTLELFKILYNSLDAVPIGPEYIANFEFAECRLSSDAIQFVKDNRSNFTVTQMATEIAAQFGQFTRAETIAFYYYKDKETKLWQVTRSAYIQGFEKRNSVASQGRKGTQISQTFYKPFICWCIENGYEYFQVARVLGYTPSTIREWANRYGYKKYTLVRGKQPDYTGKVSRTEALVNMIPEEDRKALGEQQELWDGIEENIANEITSIPERHELKLPREVKDYDDSMYNSKHHQESCEEVAAAHDEHVSKQHQQITEAELGKPFDGIWKQHELEMKTGMHFRNLKDIEHQQEVKNKEEAYGSYIRQALRDGHKVTITIPIQNVKAN